MSGSASEVDGELSEQEIQLKEIIDDFLSRHDPATMSQAAFLGAQYDAGLAWIHFPKGYGGLGMDRKLQVLIRSRLAEVGAPTQPLMTGLGMWMGAPTVLAHGSDELKQRLLRPTFTGEITWCQLFSEPGAGSDLAGLSTRAVKDGDEWVVNGQKVWNSLAHMADIGMLVTRSNPDVPKHRGLTYFVVDMHSPGVDVRPLRQMTGDAEFNEVYLTDVRIPDSNRVGAVDDGWAVALTTLMNERVMFSGSAPPRGSGSIGSALDLWKQEHGDDPDLRAELVRLWVRAEACRLTGIRATENMARGTPGPEGSVGKISFADLNKRVYELCLDIMGGEGLLYDSYELSRRRRTASFESPDARRAFLRARANSIEGGTTEIQRNILAERVLGLPKDIRTDRDLPWSQTLRG